MQWVKQLNVVFCTMLFSFSSYANLSDFKVATWNLQGSSAVNESKWNINVRQLLSGEQGADILMVQEAGSLPSSAVRTSRVIQHGGTPIEEYTWNLGTRSRPNMVYIYYSRLDVGANRVNLAIVSRRQADEAFIVHSDSSVLQSRPAVGIRIGTDVFFTVHALATGGSDAVSLIRNIFTTFTSSPSSPERRGYSWMVVGDFNRAPVNLEAALRQEPAVSENTIIIAPTEPTHRSGNILDYAILHDAHLPRREQARERIGASLMLNQLRSQITSDHFPVSFVRDR
ncbi:Deoxyribonuclease CdtB [Aggregatibacter actinomycetemcomitans]|uniref:CdtB n=1 Tax=Aggregatibacter actinomycetemcomitans TaxID=714 RepID=Q9S676_AGGAC|nr:cytolethal distending toxin nuclease subunit Aa-CdtB [Aggregatibacter actinomycetemcomitans]AAD32072.1 cytolethal distending toxin B [Aggregatibacter actinomycetemcomitans]AAQ72838.1 CdtB [Aggregatibacter actinomycetemcomitans]ACX82304.1 cytolethal distending toxin subunit CdtB [Aggregatibacter actinomycetemcomitans D11S-1]KOE57666.1 cytolethal distending toxin subunit CdtB [Aggregatibacter actinomycetemcomitans serotype c str. SCC2302]KOE61043.1 cytolethal distending toxin subunit CdtB [Ag